jgi:Cu/Ag efflux protein CusF
VYLATVILNLLAALGLLIAYAATGRDAPRPPGTPGATESTAGTARGAWVVRGIVRGTLEDGRLVVTHEELPGLMPGMTMAFALPRGVALPGGRAGDRVVLTLEVVAGELRVTALEPEAGASGFAPGHPQEPFRPRGRSPRAPATPTRGARPRAPETTGPLATCGTGPRPRGGPAVR